MTVITLMGKYDGEKGFLHGCQQLPWRFNYPCSRGEAAPGQVSHDYRGAQSMEVQGTYRGICGLYRCVFGIKDYWKLK